ncbi:MAG: hypothetical protein ABI197_13445 [Granulicella sp.]
MTEQTDLLERYLAAVGRYLPGASKNDTLAELHANLLAQMEDKEESLGRALNQAEVAEILREHGNPSIVAARYQPRRSLIGPEVFPFYWLALSRTLFIVATIVAVSGGIELIYGPPQPHPALHLGMKIFAALFYFWSWITLFFAAAAFLHTRYPKRTILTSKWDPNTLAKVEPEETRNLPKYPLADLIFHASFMVWLLAFPRFPYLFFGPGIWYLHKFSIDLAPVLYTFYWVLVAFNLMQLLFKAIAIFRSARDWRRPLKIVEKIGGLALLVILLRAHDYVILAQPVMYPARVQQAASLNQGIHAVLQLVLLVGVLQLLWAVKGLVMNRRHHAAVPASSR